MFETDANETIFVCYDSYVNNISKVILPLFQTALTLLRFAGGTALFVFSRTKKTE